MSGKEEKKKKEKKRGRREKEKKELCWAFKAPNASFSPPPPERALGRGKGSAATGRGLSGSVTTSVGGSTAANDARFLFFWRERERREEVKTPRRRHGRGQHRFFAAVASNCAPWEKKVVFHSRCEPKCLVNCLLFAARSDRMNIVYHESTRGGAAEAIQVLRAGLPWKRRMKKRQRLARLLSQPSSQVGKHQLFLSFFEPWHFRARFILPEIAHRDQENV